MNAPETTTCGDCDSTAFYRGTMDGIRIYVCREKHITHVKKTTTIDTRTETTDESLPR